MALPVTIPNAFANATASIPLSQLDANFNTLANAVNGISDGSETLANVTATVGNITTVNATTVDTTNIEVTNIKAKDGTAAGSIADSTGVVTLASSVLTTTDINGGTIDGATIGGASAAAGSFTTLGATGDVTIADKIVHSGDTNTAIRFPSNDVIGLEINGLRILEISNDVAKFPYGVAEMSLGPSDFRQILRYVDNGGGSGIFVSVEDLPQVGWLYAIETGTNNFLIAPLYKQSTAIGVSAGTPVYSNGLSVLATNAGGTIALTGFTTTGNVRMKAFTFWNFA